MHIPRQELEPLYHLRRNADDKVNMLKSLSPEEITGAIPGVKEVWRSESIEVQRLPFIRAMQAELLATIGEPSSDGRKTEIHFAYDVPGLETLRMSYPTYEIEVVAVVAISDYAESKPGEYAIMTQEMDHYNRRLLAFESVAICKHPVN